MTIEVFNRYEHKYILNRRQTEIMLEETEKHMVADKYNKNRQPYTIKNIYYDTVDDILIRRSLEKPTFKQKLRLRSYDEENRVYLELKKKYSGIVNKRRTALSPDDVKAILTGKPIKEKNYMNKQVLHEIEYFLSIHKVEEKVYIAYDRLAYFNSSDSDLRISFDFNIRTRRSDLSFLCGDKAELLLPDNTCIMEVKTATTKPLWLTHLLGKHNIMRTSFSKYGTEYRKFKSCTPQLQEV